MNCPTCNQPLPSETHYYCRQCDADMLAYLADIARTQHDHARATGEYLDNPDNQRKDTR